MLTQPLNQKEKNEFKNELNRFKFKWDLYSILILFLINIFLYFYIKIFLNKIFIKLNLINSVDKIFQNKTWDYILILLDIEFYDPVIYNILLEGFEIYNIYI